MKEELNNQLPLSELANLGLVKDGTLTMEWDNIHALKRGNMTDVLELKNETIEKESKIGSFDGRLSIVEENGKSTVRIDPVFKEIQKHPLLSDQEHNQLVNGDIANVKKERLDKEGNSVAEIIEFDILTNQFISYDPRKLKVPEAINNEVLTPEKKRKLKEGEPITLSDGTEIQYRSSDRNGFLSNRKALVVSLLLDGGLSYLLITGISMLLGRKSAEEQAHSKGFLTALKEVEIQLERKQRQFPNDKSIANELNIVKHEFSQASSMSVDELNRYSQKPNELLKTDLELNDPEIGKDKSLGKNEDLANQKHNSLVEEEDEDIDNSRKQKR